MSAPNASIQVLGQIIATDNASGTLPYKRQLNVTMQGYVFTDAQNYVISTTPYLLPIPTLNVQFVYLRNLHPSNTVTIEWTPANGTLGPVVTLGPGGAIILCNTVENASTGIISIQVAASAAQTPIEYMLGG